MKKGICTSRESAQPTERGNQEENSPIRKLNNFGA